LGVSTLIGALAGGDPIAHGSPFPGGFGHELEILRGFDPAFLSLASVYRSEACRERLESLHRKYALFQLGTERTRAGETQACPGGDTDPPESSLSPQLIHHFDFSVPDSPSRRRFRISFGTCRTENGEFRVWEIGAGFVAVVRTGDWEERHPVTPTATEFRALSVFFQDPSGAELYETFLANAYVFDLTVRPSPLIDPEGSSRGFDLDFWYWAGGTGEVAVARFSVAFDSEVASVREIHVSWP
jgi:hypothetical protein